MVKADNQRAECSSGWVRVSGIINQIDIFPPPWMDCIDRSSGCQSDQHYLLTLIDEPNIDGENKDYRIHIVIPYPAGSKGDELKPFLKVDNNYQFCARRVDAYHFIEADRQTTEEKYYIDSYDFTKE